MESSVGGAVWAGLCGGWYPAVWGAVYGGGAVALLKGELWGELCTCMGELCGRKLGGGEAVWGLLCWEAVCVREQCMCGGAVWGQCVGAVCEGAVVWSLAL